MKLNAWKVAIIMFCVVSFVAFGMASAQKKVGGGDIKFTPKGAEPVTFSHETHVNTAKLKCADCHPKVFPMKKQDIKMAKADHGQPKLCGTCHNGTKAFSQSKEADCAKCHKK